MRRKNFEHLECPVARTLDVVGEWWTLLVVRDLMLGINTFDDIQTDLEISRNILSDRLTKLEQKGVVEKKLYQERPERYKYRLTEKGRALLPVILTMADWAMQWETDGKEVMEYRHGKNGHKAKFKLVCDACGDPIDYKNIRAVPSPKARRPEKLPLPFRKEKIAR